MRREQVTQPTGATPVLTLTAQGNNLLDRFLLAATSDAQMPYEDIRKVVFLLGR